MTLVIELNDLGVRCFQHGKLLCQSAGVAVVDPAAREPLFGSSAWRESRLQPLHTYTQFWSQLNTEPLDVSHPLVRHHGDLAYLHLRHIEQQLPEPFTGQEVVFALPGSTPREHLSLLLGIANQCGLQTLSFIDSALAALRFRPPAAAVTHVEMFLHQCVLTELQLDGDHLLCQRSEVLSEQGWFSLHSQLLNYFSELFIQQCRFNPRHRAGSEQVLFDAIPGWLRLGAELERDGIDHFHCELEQHQVQVNIAALRQLVQAVWQPLQTRLARAGHIVLGDRLAQCLPLLSLPATAVALQLPQLAEDLSQLGDSLGGHTGGVRFIRSLPGVAAPVANVTDPAGGAAPVTAAVQPPATHLLCGSSVWPLHSSFSITLSGQVTREPKEPVLLQVQQGEIRAVQGELRLNGSAASVSLDSAELKAGDRLGLSGYDLQLLLVRVVA